MKANQNLLKSGLLSFLLLALAGSASAASVTENFSTDPALRGWTGNNNNSDFFSFGWSFTDNALGPANKGEIGGIICRNSGRSNWYADTTLGGLFSRTNTFSFSGTMFLNNMDANGNWFIGYFDTNSSSQNLIGIRITNPNTASAGKFRVKAQCNSSAAANVAAPATDILLAVNTPLAFSLTWTGNPDGSGTLIGTIAGTSVTLSDTRALAAESFNAFGVGILTVNNPNRANNTGFCYFDSLSYGVVALGQADIIWTGTAADNDFWNPTNWAGGVGPVTGGGQTLANVIMNNAAGVTGAGQSLILGPEASLKLTNSTLNFTDATSGISGVAGGFAMNPCVLANSTVTVQAVSVGMDVSLVNGSKLILKDSSRPINSIVETTVVRLEVGSSVTFTNGCTDPDGVGTPTPPARSVGLSVFHALTSESYSANKLNSPRANLSVTGSDFTPFGPLGGGDGTSQGDFTITALSAPVLTVAATETWDGYSNPRAAEGVTLSGSGTSVDPAIYTITNGLRITSTGKINLHSARDKTVILVIQGGDLQMEAGAVLNTERFAFRTGIQYCTLDLSGTNNITGAGTIGQRNRFDSTPRDLTIANVKNVSLDRIFMQVTSAATPIGLKRKIAITASGAVFITGTVDNSDRDGGGDGSDNITIQANSINVYDIDARGFRSGVGNLAYNGNVTLQALSPVGAYSTTDAVNNAATNKLTVRGSILTMADGTDPLEGNVTLQSVVLQLVFGTINMPPLAGKTLQVGKVRDGAYATNLFMDVSNTGQPVSYDVDWAGTYTPSAGSPPEFLLDANIAPGASVGVVYAQTLVGTATDADSDPLTFAKGPGPGWLTVAANGALSGTPAAGDLGTNSWGISVTDGTRFDVATLTIVVTPASPTLLLDSSLPGQIKLTWTGSDFVLQQNADLSNPGGWVNAPTGTNMPAILTLGSGNVFYRLKWPQ